MVAVAENLSNLGELLAGLVFRIVFTQIRLLVFGFVVKILHELLGGLIGLELLLK